MSDIIAWIILSLVCILYLLFVIYLGNQYFKLRRYKPYYNYAIWDYADEIKNRTGISKYELKRILNCHKPLSINQMLAISDVMGCDLNYLICTYSYCGNEVSY